MGRKEWGAVGLPFWYQESFVGISEIHPSLLQCCVNITIGTHTISCKISLQSVSWLMIVPLWGNPWVSHHLLDPVFIGISPKLPTIHPTQLELFPKSIVKSPHIFFSNLYWGICTAFSFSKVIKSIFLEFPFYYFATHFYGNKWIFFHISQS